MSTVTSANKLPEPVRRHFMSKLLSVPTPQLIHSLGAVEDIAPARSGRTSVFRQFNRMEPVPVPLSENGLPPPPQVLSALDIEATMKTYGTYMQLTREVVLQNQDPVLNQATLLLGICLRETEDVLVRDLLASATGFTQCVTGTNSDSPTEITDSDINVVIQLLLNADAQTIENMIGGEDKFGTSPIRNAFLGLCSTSLTTDLQSVPGFVAKNQYPNDKATFSSEWGAINNIRYFCSSIGSVLKNASALGRDVYQIFNVAVESYGKVQQDEFGEQLIYRDPNVASTLAMYGEYGWVMRTTQLIRNTEWVIRQQCTLSA